MQTTNVSFIVCCDGGAFSFSFFSEKRKSIGMDASISGYRQLLWHSHLNSVSPVVSSIPTYHILRVLLEKPNCYYSFTPKIQRTTTSERPKTEIRKKYTRVSNVNNVNLERTFLKMAGYQLPVKVFEFSGATFFWFGAFCKPAGP